MGMLGEVIGYEGNELPLALVQRLKVLDRHPELLSEVRAG
jgi:hypothetical protein